MISREHLNSRQRTSLSLGTLQKWRICGWCANIPICDTSDYNCVTLAFFNEPNNIAMITKRIQIKIVMVGEATTIILFPDSGGQGFIEEPIFTDRPEQFRLPVGVRLLSLQGLFSLTLFKGVFGGRCSLDVTNLEK